MKKSTEITQGKLFLLCLVIAFTYTKANAESRVSDKDLVFDPSMFRGSHLSQSILDGLTNEDYVTPGVYNDTPVIMNGYRVGEYTVTVKQVDKKSVVCISPSLLRTAGFSEYYIQLATKLANEGSCLPISKISHDITAKFNSNLTLEFTSPQAMLKDKDGEIAASSLSEGEDVLFSNYIFNYFHNKQTGNSSANSDYGYLNLNSGLNIGLWQFRQLSAYSYTNDEYRGGSISTSRWNNISGYVQRPIYALKSNLVIGKTNTTGQLFGGLSYSGVELSSDERMYPVSQQGYAPVITGVAKTNALVQVRQNNAIIYQTTVPPGRFNINNLNPTSYNGDLDVTVIESDGSKSNFTVPFSSVPDSVRPGKIQYSVASGKTRGLIEDKEFIDSSLQYGLNNYITIGSGLRVAKNYYSGVLNSVFSSDLGAIGINSNYSFANLQGDEGVKKGWMTNITYSKSFQPTNTNISLAGYRNSTKGYREFSDFIYEQHDLKYGYTNNWISNTYLQKYRLTASVYQPLGEFGNLSVSASTQDYNGERSRDTYYQIDYSKMLFNRINMTVSISRRKNGSYYSDNQQTSDYDTVTMVSLNIPLFDTNSSLSTSLYMDKNNGNQYQTSLSGSVGNENSPYNYNVNINHSEDGHQTSYSGNINKQYSLASMTVNGAKGEHYSQLGMGMTGAVVVHPGGILLGPYVGDTFGIVEAKGAEGAQVYNGQGSVINHSGYALIPSLMPYRYNSVGLTSNGMLNNNVDIDASEQRIAPYSGAVIKLKFNTQQGYPLLMNLLTSNHAVIPIGANVTNENGRSIGLVGQNNQAYFRTIKTKGKIKVSWGSLRDQQCEATYKINDSLIDKNIIIISSECH